MTDSRTSNNTAQSGGRVVFGTAGGPRFERHGGGQDTIFFGRTTFDGPIVIRENLTFQANGEVHVSSDELGSDMQAGTGGPKTAKKHSKRQRNRSKRSGTASSGVGQSFTSDSARNRGGKSTSSKLPEDDASPLSRALTPDSFVGNDGETADGSSQNGGAATLPSIQDDSETERGGWEKV
ncbi:hypothetical protein V865_006144 [Kwoniella europaea PYCC6329]|uniref:Pectate lyase n=1 Tax=Kwoniella europaea PYCC6329 TaxID=1423913 RepID=A0AAX4KPZ6_9TREE